MLSFANHTTRSMDSKPSSDPKATESTLAKTLWTGFQNLIETQLEALAKWGSCNGELWGVGPTVVFASAAALFLYHELVTSLIVPGDHGRITPMEKSLISTMVLGMMALMVHMWVCTMRFLQYYLDTLIRDSPNVLLEMTTVSLLGPNTEIVPVGPLMKFLRQQQPQIHITICWFLSLCYADYVRKNYCHRFNVPYLETWQAELQARATRGMTRTIAKVNSFVGVVHQHLRGLAPVPQADTAPRHPCVTICPDGRVMPGEHFCKLLGQSHESADAINKLRTYIDATRCSCSCNNTSTSQPTHTHPPACQTDCDHSGPCASPEPAPSSVIPSCHDCSGSQRPGDRDPDPPILYLRKPSH